MIYRLNGMEKRFVFVIRMKNSPEQIIIKIRGTPKEKPKRNNLKCTNNNDYSINFFKFIHNFLDQTKTKLVYVTRRFLAISKRFVILLFDRNRSKASSAPSLCKMLPSNYTCTDHPQIEIRKN